MDNNVKLSVINTETGQTEELPIVKDSLKIEWYDKSHSLIDIGTSYKFECDAILSDEFQSLAMVPHYIMVANRLCDKLNDLIEEYNAPGMPRRERRSIKREFERVLRIFQRHCTKHNVKFNFQKQ